MKKFILLIIATLFFAMAHSQSTCISYQGLAVNAGGEPVCNQIIGIKVSIAANSASGTPVYIEKHLSLTDPYGVFAIKIGLGQAMYGNFEEIDWGEGTYFLKTEIDVSGGEAYVFSGIQKLGAIPYAYYAKVSGNGFSGDYNDLSNKPILFDGNFQSLTNRPNTLAGYGISDAIDTTHLIWQLTNSRLLCWDSAYNWGNHLGRYKPISYAPSWNEILNKPLFSTVALSSDYQDLINKPTPWDSLWNSIKDRPIGNLPGDLLMWNGTAWVPVSWGSAGQILGITNSTSQGSFNKEPFIETSAISSLHVYDASSGGVIYADGGLPVISRGVCWDTLPNPTILANYSIDGEGAGSFSSSIFGLVANKTYYARAYATNSDTTFYGQDVQFTTPNGIIEITTDKFKSATNSSAIVGGTITADGGTEIIEKGVCYSKQVNPDLSDSVLVITGSTASFSATLQGLNDTTMYYFKAFATNSNGTFYGQQMAFNTVSCGGSIIVNHNPVNGIAPKEITIEYGTKTNLTSDPEKCWITRYLGAEQNANSYTDDHPSSAGWYWQFNSKKGYMHDYITLSPAWTIPTNSTDNWQSANDPCRLELGAEWRIPTRTEWQTTLSTFENDLNLHWAGYLSTTGTLTNRGTSLMFWSSNSSSLTLGWAFYQIDGSEEWILPYSKDKRFAASLRCLKNITYCSQTDSLSVITGNLYWDVYDAQQRISASISSPGGNPILNRGVVYNTTGNPVLSDTRSQSGKGSGSFSGLFQSPTTGTYYARAYGITCCDTVYGNEITFTFTTPSIETKIVTSIGISSASTGGNIVDGNQLITQRGVVYSTLPNPTTSSTKVQGSSSNSFNVTLTGLSNLTTYYVRAYLICALGTFYGSELSFTTKLPPTVVTYAATNVTSYTATLSGEVTIEGSDPVTARGFCYSTTANPTTSNSIVNSGAGPGPFSTQITGLNSTTKYYIRSFAIYLGGTVYGNQVGIKTACPTTLTKTHTLANNAPITKTVTYTVVDSVPGMYWGSYMSCWLLQNLGATHPATSVDDTSEEAAGWYWQFFKDQGYMHDGVTRTPNTTWITYIDVGYNIWWPNDPCVKLLGEGWNLPTYTEWTNVLNAGAWTTWTGAWNSVLKLHAAGTLNNVNGNLENRGVSGNYHMFDVDYPNAMSLGISSTFSGIQSLPYTRAQTIRCVKDNY